ncbi:hypothetical protein D3C75_1015810 [compost metagenome]
MSIRKIPESIDVRAALEAGFLRIFPAIPKPDPLGDEVDADETNHGPCAQGDEG